MLPKRVEQRVAEFLAADDARFDWLKPAVQRWGFLPLYLGWVATIGLRPDGSFVRLEADGGDGTPQPLLDPYWQRVALCQAARRYPELQALVPARPPGAVACQACGGTGRVPNLPEMICECGELGWLIPGEARGPSPG